MNEGAYAEGKIPQSTLYKGARENISTITEGKADLKPMARDIVNDTVMRGQQRDMVTESVDARAVDEADAFNEKKRAAKKAEAQILAQTTQDDIAKLLEKIDQWPDKPASTIN